MWLVQNNKIADTSAAQARRGKDIQGIPWERLSITREKYRQTRLEQYKNYENIPNSGEGSGKVEHFYFLFFYLYLSHHVQCLYCNSIEIIVLPCICHYYMQDCKVTKKGASYYEFRRNSRSVKSTILHFQVG